MRVITASKQIAIYRIKQNLRFNNTSTTVINPNPNMNPNVNITKSNATSTSNAHELAIENLSFWIETIQLLDVLVEYKYIDIDIDK